MFEFKVIRADSRNVLVVMRLVKKRDAFVYLGKGISDDRGCCLQVPLLNDVCECIHQLHVLIKGVLAECSLR